MSYSPAVLAFSVERLRLRRVWSLQFAALMVADLMVLAVSGIAGKEGRSGDVAPQVRAPEARFPRLPPQEALLSPPRKGYAHRVTLALEHLFHGGPSLSMLMLLSVVFTHRL